MKQQKWNMDNIPDQKGRVAIVTGSSSGIGFETARVLAGKNATIIIAVRNLGKGNNAADKIKAQYKNAVVHIMELDLANLNSVKTFADNFIKNYSRLDLLINNAGVMIPPYSKTVDGFELQFGTNYLGHFALTSLFFDLIKNTTNSRIVNVSSTAHRSGNLDFNDLNWENRKYKAWRAYGDSKISNLYFTYELQERLDNEKIKVIVAASHPGWTATDLQRHSGLLESLNGLLAQKIEIGALPTLYAATAADVTGGDYFGPSGWQEWRGYPKKVESNALSHDKNIASKLWDVSEKLTGIKFNM
ncbi:MAG TPA: SDR family NAD(P)-dependent oxidoreductase [Ignavibacteriaceae bacterium]|nr:SDR family NAD(P)-dependent oxidoreductase [Ignavibacteriaceae bacterium]